MLFTGEINCENSTCNIKCAVVHLTGFHNGERHNACTPNRLADMHRYSVRTVEPFSVIFRLCYSFAL